LDTEDIVTAYKSFFYRHGDGILDAGNLDCVWGRLTLITLRKCADRAERRDAAREVSPPQQDRAAPWLEPFGCETTPLEVAVLSERVETREIGERLGQTERTVRLVWEDVRRRL
jgi:RNA polymerase sigma-70 factor (ECF subfamily)